MRFTVNWPMAVLATVLVTVAVTLVLVPGVPDTLRAGAIAAIGAALAAAPVLIRKLEEGGE